MDEILATIRRIIAEDERSGGAADRGVAAGRRRAAAPAHEAAEGEDDVLELTDVVSEEDERAHRPDAVANAPVAPEAHGAPASAEPELDAPAVAAMSPETGTGCPPPDEVRPEAARPADVEAPASAAPPPQADDERLVSDVAALTAATAFGRLAAAPRTRREPPLVGGRRLDDIVRELLQPLLRTWLDENLPGIVERLVEAEIARISSRSGPG